MNKIVSKTYDKLRSFSNTKKQDLIVNIENSSVLVFIFKWLLTNKVSVFLSLLLVAAYVRSSSLENTWLREVNKSLILERDQIFGKTIALEKKIKEWNNKTIEASSLNEKVASEAKDLNPQAKKAKILEQIETLKTLRKR